jgi:hypothetical protein
MKHPFIILGGIGITLMVAAGVGVYFVLFYTPSPNTALRAQNPFVEVDGAAFESANKDGAEGTGGGVEDLAARSFMRAFTTRPIAGAVRMEDGFFRFVEAGTGHVYEVQNGTETKLSLTTFPRTVDAVWAPTGSRVALTQEEEGVHTTFVGALTTLDEGGYTLEGNTLSGTISNVSWSETGETLYYVQRTNTGSEGVAWNLKTDTRTTLFTTPLRYITVSWSERPLITTRTADDTVGYAYRTDHSRASEPMVALSAKEAHGITLLGGKSGDALRAWVVRGKDTVFLTRGVIPEKCAMGNDEVLCAFPRTFDASTYPDMWHRGEVSYSDEIVRFDARTGAETVVGAVDTATRNSADIIHITETAGGFLLTTADREVFFLETLEAGTVEEGGAVMDLAE